MSLIHSIEANSIQTVLFLFFASLSRPLLLLLLLLNKLLRWLILKYEWPVGCCCSTCVWVIELQLCDIVIISLQSSSSFALLFKRIHSLGTEAAAADKGAQLMMSPHTESYLPIHSV